MQRIQQEDADDDDNSLLLGACVCVFCCTYAGVAQALHTTLAHQPLLAHQSLAHHHVTNALATTHTIVALRFLHPNASTQKSTPTVFFSAIALPKATSSQNSVFSYTHMHPTKHCPKRKQQQKRQSFKKVGGTQGASASTKTDNTVSLASVFCIRTHSPHRTLLLCACIKIA